MPLTICTIPSYSESSTTAFNHSKQTGIVFFLIHRQKCVRRSPSTSSAPAASATAATALWLKHKEFP